MQKTGRGNIAGKERYSMTSFISERGDKEIIFKDKQPKKIRLLDVGID